MAKERTAASRYKSGFSDSFVSAPQYITELVCQKKAAANKQTLTREFWKSLEWKRFFASQVQAANSLLRLYSAAAIIRVLKSPQCGRIFSLRAPHLDGLFAREEATLKAEAARLEKVEETKVSTAIERPRIAYNPNKGLRSKLKDAEKEGG